MSYLSQQTAPQAHRSSKALGTDDSITTCDCCGKVNLKFTVAIELNDGEIVHYGQVCATRNTGKSRPQINGEIKARAQAQRQAARAEYFTHPAHIAERARFAQRDKLPQRLFGIAAADFVRDACDAAELVCKEISVRYGVNLWDVRA